jgi:uncharacterized short protein YbdD (DUF466 family)
MEQILLITITYSVYSIEQTLVVMVGRPMEDNFIEQMVVVMVNKAMELGRQFYSVK